MKLKRVDPRGWYRKAAGCENAVIQIFGANALVYAPTGTPDNFFFLFQEREDGTYGGIGGASDLFVDTEGNLIGFESEADTLRREFSEETGHDLLEPQNSWRYLCNTITINRYRCYPDVHGVGNYFAIQTTSGQLQVYASGDSSEGKLVILPLSNVRTALANGQFFENAAPAVARLLDMLGK